MPPRHLLHAVAVHFPIALLTAGWAAFVARRRAGWLSNAAEGLLWSGTAAACVALGLGLLAEDTVPHVPSAWRTLALHESLAWWTAGAFTALSLWRWRKPSAGETVFAVAWGAACVLLLATAREGGELVFVHGVGVLRP